VNISVTAISGSRRQSLTNGGGFGDILLSIAAAALEKTSLPLPPPQQKKASHRLARAFYLTLCELCGSGKLYTVLPLKLS
jgi:hypothetical protein